MKILLDECLPRKLKAVLSGFDVQTVAERGWAGKQDGELLQLMSGEFDIFITIDGNLTSQQNLANLNIALVVLNAYNNRLKTLQPLIEQASYLFSNMHPGEVHIFAQRLGHVRGVN